MKTLLCIFLSAVAFAAVSADPKGEKEVLAAMDAWKDAMIHNKAAVLEKILSDDLSYVHSGGQYETKADVLKSVTSGKNVITRIETSDVSVRFYDKVAVLRCRMDLWHSETNIVHMNVLHTWVKRPQGWQLVARQATRLQNP